MGSREPVALVRSVVWELCGGRADIHGVGRCEPDGVQCDLGDHALQHYPQLLRGRPAAAKGTR
jgi:hypothetical protein